MHKQSVPIQLHSDLFVRSADELMLLQTRSSNRVSVTLRAFETLIIALSPSCYSLIKSDEFVFIFFSLIFSLSLSRFPFPSHVPSPSNPETNREIVVEIIFVSFRAK